MTMPTFLPATARRALGALALVALAACGEQDLYTQLSERQANEMVAILRSAGIDADKAHKEGGFAVRTGKSDFAQAVKTLNAQGYPRETYDTMGKVFKREGFVSTPLEERARLNHALSQEISNTLASIDGVVMARVHLVVPEHNPLADKPAPAAASVFIKHRPDRDMASQVSQIKALVVNSVEGLPYDNVTVALFPAESFANPALAAKTGGAAPVPSERSTRAAALNAPLVATSVIGLVALAAGGFMWLRRRQEPPPRAGGLQAVPRRPVDPELGGPGAAAPAQGAAVHAALRRAAGQR